MNKEEALTTRGLFLHPEGTKILHTGDVIKKKIHTYRNTVEVDGIVEDAKRQSVVEVLVLIYGPFSCRKQILYRHFCKLFF